MMEIKKAFPGVSITADGKKLRAFPTDGRRQDATVHALSVLTQPPQFSGGTVSITAPWEPMIKPGDYVRFPVTYSKAEFGSVRTDMVMVNTIQFRFGTNGAANEMVVSGTAVGALGKGEE